MPKTAMLAAVLVLGAIGAPAAAQGSTGPTPPPITSLTVFGDSLVDAGNILVTTDGAVPSPRDGYFQGRFTNGYDYTDLLSIALFGTPTVASLQGGTNFAFGGARATATSAVPDLTEQLGFFRASLAAGKTVDPTGLYILNFGGNDIFGALSDNYPSTYANDSAFLLDAARTYAGGVQELSDLGARNIFITGFPNATPNSALLLSLEANGYLLNALGGLSLGDTNVYFYSYLDFFARLQANPAAFGLPQTISFTGNCRAAGAVPNCDNFFSFDGTHPTAAVHQALFRDVQSRFAFSAPVPEPSTWMMLIVGFAFVGAAMRRQCSAKVRVSYS